MDMGYAAAYRLRAAVGVGGNRRTHRQGSGHVTLEQRKTIYRIQFPVLQSYEADTWYDANGRIIFTNNRSLTSVGYDRPTWENGIKDAHAGQKFYCNIADDTMPGGPVERTIEYTAPLDRCDREQDYETAWAFFEEKYK